MSNLKIDTDINFDQQPQELEILLAQQAEIQARIASLLPSNSSYHRSPIHKQQQQQQQQRRSHNNVPRSMSTSSATMARHLSSVGTSRGSLT